LKSHPKPLMDPINEILDFWFEGLNTNEAALDNQSQAVKKWFKKDSEFDKDIKAKFEKYVKKAKIGELKDWEGSSSGRMALIILLDQFTRNMYRNMPDTYAMDTMALELSKRFLEEGVDQELSFPERVFLYMPLMHSENLHDQELCIEYFKRLVGDSRSQNSINTAYYEYNLKYAIDHQDIIKQFGRFPHRNSLLGRESTKEESAFLKQEGASF